MIFLDPHAVAKQEAFDEKSRLRNQFRSLDEDEVEFLDSVLESTRAQEAAVKRETAAQLEAFRRHREEAEKALLDQSSSDANTEKIQGWTAPVRKRRRDQHRDLLFPGKKRKASVTENVPEKDTHNGQDLQTEGGDGQHTLKPSQTTPAVPATSSTTAIDTVIQPKVTPHVENGQKTIGPTKPDVSLGLGGYSSDSE